MHRCHGRNMLDVLTSECMLRLHRGSEWARSVKAVMHFLHACLRSELLRGCVQPLASGSGTDWMDFLTVLRDACLQTLRAACSCDSWPLTGAETCLEPVTRRGCHEPG